MVHQLFVIQLLDTGQTFCQNLTVASVASEGEVLFSQQISLADCGCLLSQGQMGRTRISCLNVRIFRLSLDLVQHISNSRQMLISAVDTEQVFLGIVAFLYFLPFTLFLYTLIGMSLNVIFPSARILSGSTYNDFGMFFLLF